MTTEDRIRAAFIAGVYAGFSVTREGYNAEWAQDTLFPDGESGEHDASQLPEMVKFAARKADEHLAVTGHVDAPDDVKRRLAHMEETIDHMRDALRDAILSGAHPSFELEHHMREDYRGDVVSKEPTGGLTFTIHLKAAQ